MKTKNFYTSKLAMKQLIGFAPRPKFLLPVNLTFDNSDLCVPAWLVLIRQDYQFYMEMESGSVIEETPIKAEIMLDGFEKETDGILRKMKYLDNGDYVFEIIN